MDTDINSHHHHHHHSHHHHHHNHHHDEMIGSPSDDTNGDGEGVWSPDIEECFREALEMFPPCGRRKHILQEEGGGKMYGRNELIARHIKMKTGKLRTRKQVSSHIQVLARRKAKSEVSMAASSNGVSPSPSSVASGGQNTSSSVAESNQQQQQQQQMQIQLQQQLSRLPTHRPSITTCLVSEPSFYADVWYDRPIATQKIRLVEFSAFSGPTRHYYVQIDYRQTQTSSGNSYIDAGSSLSNIGGVRGGIRQTREMLENIHISQIQDKFPGIIGPKGYLSRGSPDSFFLVKFWADLGNDFEFNLDDQNSCFGFSSHFETIEPYKYLTCSTIACSYGIPMVEKIEKIFGEYNNTNGRFSYNLDRSPMCEFMTQFIKKFRQLPQLSHMNSVLENFTVLQVIESESSLPIPEVVLCLAYVFEVASMNHHNNGPSYHVYKLTKD